MRRSSLFGLLISLAFLFGCSEMERPNVEGVIVDVYKEWRIGDSDGTTIVRGDDGQIYKYAGRLGKKGDRIGLKGINAIRY